MLDYCIFNCADEIKKQQKLIESVYPIHKAFRANFAPFATVSGYLQHLCKIVAEGATFVVVQDTNDGKDSVVIGVVLYRMHHNTYQNKLFFLEDLVITETERSQGYGGQILAWCENEAKQAGCEFISLDSGVFRPKAHKFYFTKDYIVESFHFIKRLNE